VECDQQSDASIFSKDTLPQPRMRSAINNPASQPIPILFLDFNLTIVLRVFIAYAFKQALRSSLFSKPVSRLVVASNIVSLQIPSDSRRRRPEAKNSTLQFLLFFFFFYSESEYHVFFEDWKNRPQSRIHPSASSKNTFAKSRRKSSGRVRVMVA